MEFLSRLRPSNRPERGGTLCDRDLSFPVARRSSSAQAKLLRRRPLPSPSRLSPAHDEPVPCLEIPNRNTSRHRHASWSSPRGSRLRFCENRPLRDRDTTTASPPAVHDGTQAQLEAKREAHRRRRNIQEGWDLLGAQDVKPETGAMDVLTSETATGPSPFNSYLDGLAHRVREARQAYKDAKTARETVAKRNLSTELATLAPSARDREAVRQLRRQHTTRWKKGEARWCSALDFEPKLSPIAQSQRSGTTTGGAARGDSGVEDMDQPGSTPTVAELTESPKAPLPERMIVATDEDQATGSWTGRIRPAPRWRGATKPAGPEADQMRGSATARTSSATRAALQPSTSVQKSRDKAIQFRMPPDVPRRLGPSHKDTSPVKNKNSPWRATKSRVSVHATSHLLATQPAKIKSPARPLRSVSTRIPPKAGNNFQPAQHDPRVPDMAQTPSSGNETSKTPEAPAPRPRPGLSPSSHQPQKGARQSVWPGLLTDPPRPLVAAIEGTMLVEIPEEDPFLRAATPGRGKERASARPPTPTPARTTPMRPKLSSPMPFLTIEHADMGQKKAAALPKTGLVSTSCTSACMLRTPSPSPSASDSSEPLAEVTNRRTPSSRRSNSHHDDDGIMAQGAARLAFMQRSAGAARIVDVGRHHHSRAAKKRPASVTVPKKAGRSVVGCEKTEDHGQVQTVYSLSPVEAGRACVKAVSRLLQQYWLLVRPVFEPDSALRTRAGHGRSTWCDVGLYVLALGFGGLTVVLGAWSVKLMAFAWGVLRVLGTGACVLLGV